MGEKVTELVQQARAGLLTLKDLQDQVQREFILQTLAGNALNQCTAAKVLGCHRNTLSRDMERLRIEVRSVRQRQRENKRAAKKMVQRAGYVQRLGGHLGNRVAERLG